MFTFDAVRVTTEQSLTVYYDLHSCWQEHHSAIITGGPNLEDLGVQLTPFEYYTHSQLRTYRTTRYKEDALMEDLAEPGPEVIKHLNRTPIDPLWNDPAHGIDYNEWMNKWAIRDY